MPYKMYKKAYAAKTNQSLITEEAQEDNLVFKNLFKYSKTNQFHVHFGLESGRNALFVIIYSAGETMENVDYIETQVTDGDIPNIEFFDDPQSEEATAILSRYSLTGDDIENAGLEGYERITKHYPEEDVKESLKFEKMYGLIMGCEEENS